MAGTPGAKPGGGSGGVSSSTPPARAATTALAFPTVQRTHRPAGRRPSPCASGPARQRAGTPIAAARAARTGRGRTAEADPPPLEEDGPVGDGGGHVDRLLDDDDRDPAGRQGPDDLQQVGHDRGRQAERQLVDHQQAWAGTRGPGRGPASAARRPTGGRPAGSGGPAAPGTGRRPARWPPGRTAGSLWWRRAVQAARRRFSSTVSEVKMLRPPSTVTRPAFTRSTGDRSVTSCPRYPIRPDLGRSRPEMARRMVVLPAPLVPSRATTSRWDTPSAISKRTWGCRRRRRRR